LRSVYWPSQSPDKELYSGDENHAGGERAKEMLQFSPEMLGIRIWWALEEQADAPVIGTITSQIIVGLYSMPKDLTMLPNRQDSR
jgi:hypothetical protein